jgi:ribose transport system permease protein
VAEVLPQTQDEHPAAAQGPGDRNARRSILGSVDWREYVVYAALVLVFTFFAVMAGDRGFLTGSNLLNIVRQTTSITIMAVGMVFALCAGEIDLSIGSVVALSSLVAAVLLRDGSIALAVAGGLGVGLGVPA